MTPPRRRRDTELALRQQMLLSRCAELRTGLAETLVPWEAALSWAGGAGRVWAWLKTHPEWWLGALVVGLALRPAGSLRWGLRLWNGWRLWRQLSATGRLDGA